MTARSIVADGATQPASAAAARARLWWLPSWLQDGAGLAGLAVTILLWYLASATLRNVPPPYDVWDNIASNLMSSERLPGIGLPRGGYLPHLANTAFNVLAGGAAGALLGIATGLYSATSRLFADIVAPVITFITTIPIVIMAPFFLMWFGLSGAAQIALVAMYTASILHLFAYRGAGNIPSAFLDYAATLGASSVLQFLLVRLPGAAPEIFGGLRIAFAGAWGLAAVTEMLGGQFGSGRVLVALRSVYDLTGIMAVVLLLGVMAILFDWVLVALRRYTLRWMA